MADKLVVIVYHSSYGCDTGCCGHRIEWFKEEDTKQEGFDPFCVNNVGASEFEFSHPYSDSEDDRKEFAKRLVASELGEEHVKDLDWEHCIIEDN